MDNLIRFARMRKYNINILHIKTTRRTKHRSMITSGTESSRVCLSCLSIISFWYSHSFADEAHVFRNPKSVTAKGVWALRKKHALCLTGTPAQVHSTLSCYALSSAQNNVCSQNSVKDYYPLFRLLEVKYENIDDLDTYVSKIVPRTKRSPFPPGGERLLRVRPLLTISILFRSNLICDLDPQRCFFHRQGKGRSKDG